MFQYYNAHVQVHDWFFFAGQNEGNMKGTHKRMKEEVREVVTYHEGKGWSGKAWEPRLQRHGAPSGRTGALVTCQAC